MSQLPCFVTACALLSLAACAGDRQHAIDNTLGTGRRDAGADAGESDAAADDDWPWADSGESSAAPDAERGEPDGLDAAVDARSGEGETDARSLLGDGAQLEASSSDADGTTDAGNTPEAAAADAGATLDAGEVLDAAGDAGAARLRLTLTRGGVPVPQVTVFFHGVEEQVVGSAETDLAGRVQTDLGVSALTVRVPIQSETFSAHLFTYFGLEQGDDLKLELPPESARQDSYMVSFAPVQGAVRYDVNGGPYGCVKGSLDGTGTSVLGSHQPGCLAPNNTLLISSWLLTTDSRYIPSSFARVANLPRPSPSESPLAVTAEAFSSGRDVSVSLQGATHDLSLQTGLWAFWGEQGAPLGVKSRSESLSADGSVEYVAPSFAFDAFLSTGFYYGEQVSHRLSVRSATTESPGVLDLSHALPDIRDFTIDSAQLNAPRVYWNSDDSNARDAFLFEAVLRVSGLDGSRVFDALWTGVTRPTANGVRLPPVPSALLPDPDPSWGVRWEAVRMSEVQSTQADGYRGFRQETLRYQSFFGDLVELRLSQPGEAEVVTWDPRS